MINRRIYQEIFNNSRLFFKVYTFEIYIFVLYCGICNGKYKIYGFINFESIIL